MLTVDRSSGTSVHDQLLEQLRFRIASGQHQVGATLPSTRRLADMLGVSFHTVRKVYQDLEREGLLEARPGSGYVVTERTPPSKAERMERGAAVVQDALHRLVGLGLEDAEVEYLFQEQMALLEGATSRYKLVAAARYRERAELCAAQIKRHVQQTVEATVISALTQHQDADYVFVQHADVRSVMQRLPRADVLGIVTFLSPEALERIARLLDDQTLGVVTRYPDAITPLTAEIRAATGFSGQMMAASVDESARHLQQFIDQTDLIVYTPPCRRRLHALIGDAVELVSIGPVISRESLETIRQTVPV